MNLLESHVGRRALFAALYFSEGAPIGFIWWALPTVLRDAGIEVDRIGALVGVLVLPWAFKFLWAPLVDIIRGPRWTLRAWIVASQTLMIVTLAPLLWLVPNAAFGAIALCLFGHALAAATQDVAVDALAITTTGRDEHGAINAWMQAGMLAGRAVFGGGALLVIGRVGTSFVIAALMITIAVTLLVALTFEIPPQLQVAATDVGRSARAVGSRLRAAFGSRNTWLALTFAATGGAGFEAVGALAGPFLVDHGQTADAVGWFFAVPALVAMVVGGVAGGYASDRLGRRLAVSAFGIAVAAVIGWLALSAAWNGADAITSTVAMTALYFCIGLFTASSYALFMDLTDPRIGSTQFSAFMGATNLCEAWAAAAVGRLVVSRGYPLGFGTMAMVGLVALLLLAAIRPTSERGTHH